MTVREQSTEPPPDPRSGARERKNAPGEGRGAARRGVSGGLRYSARCQRRHISPLCTDMQMEPPQNAEHQISFNLFLSARSLAPRSPHSPSLSLSFSLFFSAPCFPAARTSPPPPVHLPCTAVSPFCLFSPPPRLVLACALSEDLQEGKRISLHATSKDRGQIKSGLALPRELRLQ